MELFELLGKIVISGTDEANRNIDSVAENAEKNALRIYRAFENISKTFSENNIRIPDFSVKYKSGIPENSDVSGSVFSLQTLFDSIENTVEKLSFKPHTSEPDNVQYNKNYETENNVNKNISETYKTENYENIFRHENFSESVDIRKNITEFSLPSFDDIFSNAEKLIKQFSQPYEYSTTTVTENIRTEKKISETDITTDETLLDKAFRQSEMINQNLSDVTFKGGWEMFLKSAEDACQMVEQLFGTSEISPEFSPKVNMPDLKDFSKALKTADTSEIDAYIQLINEKLSEIYTAGEDTFVSQTEQIPEYIRLMKEAVEKGMPSVTQTQVSELERLYVHSRAKWNKISGTAAEGTAKMSDGIRSAVPSVLSACNEVGNAVVNALGVDASGSGRYLMGTFGNGISQKAWEVYNAVSGIAQNIASIMSGITFSGISATASVESVSVPEYATGGIVTKEHIARVGEDGAEAIIPLEHNTEWIDRVAERMSGSTSNSEVVTKLDELNSNIKNLRIYLDGKSLVGGIVNEMDRKLGSMARLKRRIT